MSRVYLLRGEPVVLLARGTGPGPRNALLLCPNGAKYVRPFRGLRRLRLAERESKHGTLTIEDVARKVRAL